jgi:hypothetical protein
MQDISCVSDDSNAYGRQHDLVDHYGISVSQMNTDRFHLSLALSGQMMQLVIAMTMQYYKSEQWCLFFPLFF